MSDCDRRCWSCTNSLRLPSTSGESRKLGPVRAAAWRGTAGICLTPYQPWEPSSRRATSPGNTLCSTAATAQFNLVQLVGVIFPWAAFQVRRHKAVPNSIEVVPCCHFLSAAHMYLFSYSSLRKLLEQREEELQQQVRSLRLKETSLNRTNTELGHRVQQLDTRLSILEAELTKAREEVRNCVESIRSH